MESENKRMLSEAKRNQLLAGLLKEEEEKETEEVAEEVISAVADAMTEEVMEDGKSLQDKIAKEEAEKSEKIAEINKNNEIISIISSIKGLCESAINLKMEGLSENLKAEAKSGLDKLNELLREKLA